MPELVVFMGDSITQDWPLTSLLPGDAIVNAGIGGQTTGQMRARFARDVLEHRPGIVHILGGINDIAENDGPVTIEEIISNLAAMTDAARQAGIEVVLGTLLPCTAIYWRPQIRPVEPVRDLNRGIREAASARGLRLADYFVPLADQAGQIDATMSDDGLHPNAKGYAAMGPVMTAALRPGRPARVTAGR